MSDAIHLPGLSAIKSGLLGSLSPGLSALRGPLAPWQPDPIKLPARTPHPSIPLFDLTEEVCEAASVAEREAIVEDLAARGTLHLPFDKIAVRFPMDQISSALNWLPLEMRGVHCTFVVCGALEIANFFSSDAKRPGTKPLSDNEEDRFSSEEELKEEIASGHVRKMRVVSTVNGMAGNWLIENDYGISILNLNEHKHEAGFLGDYFGMAWEALTILIASLACKNVVKDVRYNGQIGRGAHAVPVYENGGVTFISMTRVNPPLVSELTGEPGKAKKPHMRRGHEHTVVHGKGRTLRRVQWFAPCYVGYDPAFAPPAPHEYRVTP